MNMAKKLLQLKQDFDEVYEAGKAAGGGSGDYEQGYEDGKNSVGNPLEYADKLYETFYGVTFPDEYELSLNLPNVTSLNSAFYGAKGIKKVTIKGNTAGNEVVFNRAFRGSPLETIDLSEFNVIFGADLTTMCAYCSNLTNIIGELDFSNVTGGLNNAFEGANQLVTFTPKPNSIKISIKFAANNKLSDTSIQSIIDGLADLSPRYYIAAQTGPDTYENTGILIENVISATAQTADANGVTIYWVEYGIAPPNIYGNLAYKEGGGTTQTLTLHSTVGNKLTDTQKATITAKNWTLVY